MPRTPDPARTHRRIRQDHAQETAEDYVEAIAQIIDRQDRCRVVDLTERFGVAHVTVIKIIRRLEQEGLVQTEPYRPIELTPRGQKLARDCETRHQLVYDFLRKLGVRAASASADAEGIEHHLSKETLARMRAFIKAKP